jgi:hypothetical protein
MTKSVEELLSIYSIAYLHYSKDIYAEVEILGGLAKFANMIAKDPLSDLTQKTALEYKYNIEKYHSETIEKLYNKDNKDKIYPCICLKNYICKYISHLEKKIFEDEELYDDYQRWLSYKKDYS